jgi:hypothetical protein
MKTTNLKNNVLLFSTLLLICALIFISNQSKSQQINNDYKLVACMNLNKFENNETEQSLRQVTSEKIIKHLKLSLKERALLMEIKQLSNEAKQCLNDADKVAKDIDDISITKVNPDKKLISDLKIKRKIKRQENYESSLRYDAEELFEMCNDLLFNIYQDHFPTSVTLFAKNNKYQQQVNDLSEQAQELYKKAKNNEDKAIYDLNYLSGLDYLKKANFIKREAIKKYEQAYSLYYNITISKNEYEALPDKININIPSDQELVSDNTLNNNANNILTSKENIENNSELNTSNELIIYRIQVGAFTKKVDLREFNGLNPLSEDKTDQKEFSKFMVGEYFSYKAANEAKRIIASKTKYQDAFIVAYKKDLRVPISNELIK